MTGNSRFIALVALFLAATTLSVHAAPKRLIILRHGEKHDAQSLCSVGKERAQALAAQYLSPTHPLSLLKNDPPAAILAMTLHTLETARPIAKAWGLEIKTDPIMLMPIQNNRYFNARLNEVNRKQAIDLMENPRWFGKTVVAVWEHYHIASLALQKEFSGEEATLRQLLNLDKVQGLPPHSVPDTWPNGNYNFFWIFTYDSPQARAPSSFKVVQQEFAEPFANLPSNAWGAPEPLPANSGCD